MPTSNRIHDLLGAEAEDLLTYRARGFPRGQLHLPGPDFVDRVVAGTDRNPQVLRSMQQILGHGRLSGTGYVSILPVDQGIEHSAGASFAPNPVYFDRATSASWPWRRVQRGRVHAGRAGLRVAQVRAPDPLPGQAQPQRAADLPQPLRPGHVRECAAGVGAGGGGGRGDGLFRVRPGDAPAAGGVGSVPDAHELGMVTVLWCYLRQPAFNTGGRTTTPPPT